jgi:hypothetical protein
MEFLKLLVPKQALLVAQWEAVSIHRLRDYSRKSRI